MRYSFLLLLFMITLLKINIIRGETMPSQGLNIENAIDSLFKEAKEKKDAYLLSVPLLASAQRQDAKRYPEIHLAMREALNQLPSSSFKAWLIGRDLFAAQCMKRTEAVKEITKELKTLLATEKKPTADEFYAWSLGYLSLNKDEYDAKQMQDANRDVTDQYDAELKKITDHDEKKTKSALSNALWAWVMTVQAAANKPDQETFNDACKAIKTLTHAKTMGKALQGIPATDFRAWAMSAVSLAAVRIQKDHPVYGELKKSLEEAMQEAKNTQTETKKPSADLMLARVNVALANDYLHPHVNNATPAPASLSHTN